MNIKRNPLKILTAFIAASIATIFGFSSSKAPANNKASLAPTIEERLTKVREQIGEREVEVYPLIVSLTSSEEIAKDDDNDKSSDDKKDAPPTDWKNGPKPWDNG